MCELEQNYIYFQNEDVTALKIKYNPFAKAFLDKPNNNGSGSPDNNNPHPMSNHQHQQQQQQQQQEFQLLDQVAALNNSHHHHQFHSGLQQQQQQHRYQQRHLPYNVQQRFHHNNSGSSQLTSGNGSPPGLGGMIMKDEPSPLYTPNYWGHSSSSPGSSNTFLETSAFDSMWNGCGGNSGAYFAPPVTSSPPSNYTIFILLFLEEA
jgi:hypothetical protein